MHRVAEAERCTQEEAKDKCTGWRERAAKLARDVRGYAVGKGSSKMNSEKEHPK